MLFKKKLEIREHGSPIYSVDGSENFVYTTSGDKFVLKWNLDTGQQERFSIKLDNTSYCLAFDSNNLYIGTKKGELYVIDTLSKKLIYQRKICESAIHSFLIMPTLILVGNEVGELVFLSSEDFSEIKKHIYSCGKIRGIIQLDSKRIAFASRDGYIRILLGEQHELEHQFHAHEKGANKLLVIGNFLYSTGKDGCLKKWNWQEEIVLQTWPIHRGTIYDLKRIGNYIVTASRDKTIKIWRIDPDLQLAQKIMVVNGGHSYSVNGLYVKNENLFCSVGDDRRLIVWEKD